MRAILLTLVVTLLIGTGNLAHAGETCGDGLDNDSDGFCDDGCWPAGVTNIAENPMSRNETGDVAPLLGTLVYQVPLPDLNPKVPYGPPLTFRRTYFSGWDNSGFANYRKAMGQRWHHNFMSWLDANPGSGGDARVHVTTGQDVWFSYSSTNGGYDYFTPQAGHHFKHLRQATSSPYKWELKMLTGETHVFDWNAGSKVGKLIEVQDAHSTPNKITITYFTSGTNSGQIDRIDDASGKKRLAFEYTSGVVTKVNFQTVSGITSTTRSYVSWAYSSTDPTSITSDGTTIQTMTYSSNYLTLLEDAAGNDIVSFAYLAASAGQIARVATGNGGLGFEYAPSHAQCTGSTKTLLFFNVANATSCSTDTDCGGSLRCGGKTGTGSTGKCYRAARCVTSTQATGEDLVTTVAALTPCTGACAPKTEYSWNTTTLDLKGVKLADNNWTSYDRNSNGMVTVMAEGDTDADATNTGGLKTWFWYDTNFPGRATEIRHRSSLVSDTQCSATEARDCKQTIFSWGSTTGLLNSKQDKGWTHNASNAVVTFDYTTAYTYETDGSGRLKQIDGPLSGTNDVIDFTYHSSTDVLKDKYLNEVKRKKDTSNFVTTTFDDYDYWGNAGSQKDPDATFTCRTYDSSRNYLKVVREAMNGQTSCATSHSSDLVTDFTHDSWLQLTKTIRPLGDCQHKEYTDGRLSKIKLRDDCVAANAGNTLEYSHDTNGLVTKGELKDSSGSVTFRREGTYFDGLQIEKLINPVATSYHAAFSYYADGERELLTFENTLGKTKWEWDAQNRETYRRRYKDATNYDSWAFTYGFGPIRKYEKVTDDASKNAYGYLDDLDRKTKISNPDSNTNLHVHDAASRLATMVEAYGLTGQVTHTFTHDNVGRKLTETYGGQGCAGEPGPVAQVQYTYDAAPVSCPTGATCAKQQGRLAYVKESLLCDSSGDYRLWQETFMSYDAAGRLEQEYIQDDSGRTAIQSYEYDKNGNVTKITAPSGVAMGFTFGGSGNSDTNLISTLWRYTGSTTNLLTNIAWQPFGPVKAYDQANTISGNVLKATLTWNLAYRASEIKFATTAVNKTEIDYTEDEKGRYTAKTYSNVHSGIQANYLQYDWFDRITCDAAASGTCPTSGSNLKTNVTTYDASNDRTSFYHRSVTFGDYQYNVSRTSGTDKISSFTRTGVSGSTSLTWDDRGNRTRDDNSATTLDKRDYAFDGRRRVNLIGGSVPSGSKYNIVNAYDRRDRRVFRSYLNDATSIESHWFFYYDLEDRLIEVKYTPDISDTSTYQVFQFYWLGKRPIAYVATSYPGAAVARYFIHSDESNRAVEVYDWPTSGDATRVWAVNPDVFGWDDVAYTSGIYQPLRLNNAYYEDGTVAMYSSTVADRPALLTERGILYDPLTESFGQRVGTWPHESYSKDAHDPATKLGVAAPRTLQTRPSFSSNCESNTKTTIIGDISALTRSACLNCVVSDESTGEVIFLDNGGGGWPLPTNPCVECRTRQVAGIIQSECVPSNFWAVKGWLRCTPNYNLLGCELYPPGGTNCGWVYNGSETTIMY